MTKLSKSVNKNEEDNKNEEQNSSSLSISKKINKENTENNTDTKDENTSQLSQKSENKTTKKEFKSSSVEDIAEWLVGLIGDGVFNQLKENPYLQLPYTDSDLDIKGWLSKAIKTIFTQENIQNIGTSIQNNNSRLIELEQVVLDAEKAKAEIDDKIEKYNQKFQQIKSEMDELEEEKFDIQKELNTALPLSTLINEVYRDPGNESQNHKKLITMLNDSLENTDEKDLSLFVIRFSKGWMYLKSNLDELGEDEKENLEKVHKALSMFLSFISGIFIAERRPLLDIIAKICSDYFSEYDFISPEQTLQVDPDIHNAEGVGNARIKEGISFAVVRKETRKAVKYADIRVQ